jgi:1-acyl-sn-glycerol-3-phosphate acyltransferase
VAEPVYRPVIGLARLVFAAQGLRFTIHGSEHVPRTGGAVMVINHIGYLDFAYAGLAARPAGRMVRFMAKQEVFDHKISGPLMRGMRHIPVDREAGANSFRAAVAALKAGEIVGVFPEATISRSFELKEFKAGATRMASTAKVPLLPTVLWGSHRVWTKDHPKRLGRTRFPITIAVGEPLDAPRGADAGAATEELRRRMQALLHQAQATYPAQPRDDDDRWWLPARLGGAAPSPEEAARLDEEERVRRAERRAQRQQR